MRKRIAKYAALYAAAIPLPRPGSGDCFYCQMKTQDGKTLGDASSTDHLTSHMEEGYVVPSLAYNAMMEAGAGPAWFWSVFQTEQKTGEQKTMEAIGGTGFLGKEAPKNLAKWVRKYVQRRLGLVR